MKHCVALHKQFAGNHKRRRLCSALQKHASVSAATSPPATARSMRPLRTCSPDDSDSDLTPNTYALFLASTEAVKAAQNSKDVEKGDEVVVRGVRGMLGVTWGHPQHAMHPTENLNVAPHLTPSPQSCAPRPQMNRQMTKCLSRSTKLWRRRILCAHSIRAHGCIRARCSLERQLRR